MLFVIGGLNGVNLFFLFFNMLIVAKSDWFAVPFASSDV